MRAYVVASGVRIEPLGDLAKDLPIGNEPLGQIQRRLFGKLGLEVVDVAKLEDVPSGEARIVTYDNVYFTRRVLKSFLERWKRTESAQLALPASSTIVQHFTDLQDLERTEAHALYRFYGLAPGATTTTGAAPLEVIYEERIVEVPVPHHVNADLHWPHPITTSVVFHVRHWLNYLEANRLAVQIDWVDFAISHPVWILSRLAWAAIPGRGRFLWRLLGAANRVHRTADVHPTARLEGCVIGPGARIGAQSFARAAIIGEGATLEERSTVAYSVIGPGCFVSRNASIYASVSLEKGALGMSMQLCVTGKKVALTPRATPMDLNLAGGIRVKDGDRLVETHYRALGACIGHEVFLGPDVFIAPGRAIPNGVLIGPSPDRVLSQIASDQPAGKYSVIEGGKLVVRDD